MSAASRREQLVFGAPPRADLLPPEIKHDEGIRRQRRGLFGLVVVVVAITVLGYIFALGLAVAAQQRLAEANDETAAIAVERAKYVEGETLSNQITSAKLARQMATYLEADWALYLSSLGITLPEGMFIETIDLKLPDVAPPGPVVADPNTQIATVQLLLGTTSTGPVPDWIDTVDSMPGLVGVTPTGLQYSDEKHIWELLLTIHVDASQLENRFADDTEEDSK